MPSTSSATTSALTGPGRDAADLAQDVVVGAADLGVQRRVGGHAIEHAPPGGGADLFDLGGVQEDLHAFTPIVRVAILRAGRGRSVTTLPVLVAGDLELRGAMHWVTRRKVRAAEPLRSQALRPDLIDACPAARRSASHGTGLPGPRSTRVRGSVPNCAPLIADLLASEKALGAVA